MLQKNIAFTSRLNPIASLYSSFLFECSLLSLPHQLVGTCTQLHRGIEPDMYIAGSSTFLMDFKIELAGLAIM
jgi:hypothetical protein